MMEERKFNREILAQVNGMPIPLPEGTKVEVLYELPDGRLRVRAVGEIPVEMEAHPSWLDPAEGE